MKSAHYPFVSNLININISKYSLTRGTFKSVNKLLSSFYLKGSIVTCMILNGLTALGLRTTSKQSIGYFLLMFVKTQNPHEE